MATDFLNDARREIEGWTEDFYGELKAFYQGNAKAEQHLMEQTTQPFWQSLCLSGKRLQQRDLTVDMEMQEPVRPADYDGPKKDGYDYTCTVFTSHFPWNFRLCMVITDFMLR